MDSFEYVMVLVSIIIGLAITHMLAAFGRAVQRIRGKGPPIQLDVTYLIWVAFVFIWTVSFWWWEFKFQDVAVEWTFGLYMFIVGYAICLFMLAVVLVPTDMEGVEDSYEFLVDGRRWIFGMMLAVMAFDIADTFLKGAGWGLRPVYLAQTGVITCAMLVGLFSTRRRYQLSAALLAFAWQFVYMFSELGILGGF